MADTKDIEKRVKMDEEEEDRDHEEDDTEGAKREGTGDEEKDEDKEDMGFVADATTGNEHGCDKGDSQSKEGAGEAQVTEDSSQPNTTLPTPQPPATATPPDHNWKAAMVTSLQQEISKIPKAQQAVEYLWSEEDSHQASSKTPKLAMVTTTTTTTPRSNKEGGGGEEGGCISTIGNAHENEYVNDIQPLPAPRQLAEASLPGAYAVAGCLPDRLHVAARSDHSTSDNEDEEQRVVVMDDLHHPEPFEAETVLDLEQQQVHVEASRQSRQVEVEEVIEASLMADEESRRPPRATPTAKTATTSNDVVDDSNKRTKTVLCFCMVVVVGVVGIFVLVTAVLRSNTATTPSSSYPVPQTNNTSGPDVETTPLALYPPYHDDLPLNHVNKIQEIGSDLYWANIWMLQDPNLGTYSYERQLQRFGLVVFYYSTRGDNWTCNEHWLSYTTSECEWYSSSSMPELQLEDGSSPGSCDENGRIINISLANNNLQGSIVLFLDFPFLKIFDIANNHIRGNVPPVVAGPELEVVIFSNNQLEGALVSDGSFFAATKLRIVKLDGNRLAGYNPAVYLILPHLEIINVTGNLYDGPITTYFQYCKNLTYIGNGHNLLTGTVPTELGLLTRLEGFDISGNIGLSGTIPTELEALPNLALLDISETSLTGSIPAPFCSGMLNESIVIHANCSHVQCCGND